MGLLPLLVRKFHDQKWDELREEERTFFPIGRIDLDAFSFSVASIHPAFSDTFYETWFIFQINLFGHRWIVVKSHWNVLPWHVPMLTCACAESVFLIDIDIEVGGSRLTSRVFSEEELSPFCSVEREWELKKKCGFHLLWKVFLMPYPNLMILLLSWLYHFYFISFARSIFPLPCRHQHQIQWKKPTYPLFFPQV
jgi:hypothetical protein